MLNNLAIEGQQAGAVASPDSDWIRSVSCFLIYNPIPFVAQFARRLGLGSGI